MRVSFYGITGGPGTARTGEVVGFVHLPIVNPQRPLSAHSNDEPLPNVWGIVVDESTGVFCTAPLYNIKRAESK